MLFFLGNRAKKRLSKNLLSIKIRGVFRKPTSPPLNLKFFLKSTRPSLPLKKAPPLFPSPFPLRGQGMCQPPYSVLKPLRYMVGGPSEVYASSGAAVFLCGNEPALLKSCLWKRRDTMKDARCWLLATCWDCCWWERRDTNKYLLLWTRFAEELMMGTQGHNAGCGDDNTFYSTLDRIDSGEVPIRVMAEILWPSLAFNEWHQRLRPLPNNSECKPIRTNTIALLFLSNQIKSVSFSIWHSI